MSKSKQSQQQHAKSWKGQTHLNGFFSGPSNQSKQPVIEISMVSDTELDTIEPVEAALDHSPSIPIVPQSR